MLGSAPADRQHVGAPPCIMITLKSSILQHKADKLFSGGTKVTLSSLFTPLQRTTSPGKQKKKTNVHRVAYLQPLSCFYCWQLCKLVTLHFPTYPTRLNIYLFAFPWSCHAPFSPWLCKNRKASRRRVHSILPSLLFQASTSCQDVCLQRRPS